MVELARHDQQPARAALEFQAVSKSYGQVAALTDISFRIEPGVTGLVGQNGAGKSSLMKLACGLLRASLGQILVAGEPPTSLAARRRIGYCPDIDRFYERLSGQTFVAWMLRLHGFGFQAAKRRAGEQLERLGLGPAMHRAIAGYSKGMRQRVKLAQALAHEPDVVLLDEPLTGLDPVARHEMGEVIRALGRRGAVVLVSSHVLHELQAVADRMLLVHQGRLLADGRVAELRDQVAGRPRRLHLQSRDPRALGARLCALEQVAGVALEDRGVVVEVRGSGGLFDVLTEIGTDPRGLVEAIEPLDDNLEAVFGYLTS